MSAVALQKILYEIEELNLEEKVQLADRLYSQVGSSREIAAAWGVELDRRASLMAAGKMNSVTLAEFRESYRERISRHRQRAT